jgi:hypothetical protein
VVRGGIAKPSLGIDGAAKMVVQVAALGHAGKKGVQGERARCACLLHAGCRLLLRRGDLRIRGKKLKQNGKQQSKLREAASAESSFRVAPRGRLTPVVSSPERTATRTDY